MPPRGTGNRRAERKDWRWVQALRSFGAFKKKGPGWAVRLGLTGSVGQVEPLHLLL